MPVIIDDTHLHFDTVPDYFLSGYALCNLVELQLEAARYGLAMALVENAHAQIRTAAGSERVTAVDNFAELRAALLELLPTTDAVAEDIERIYPQANVQAVHTKYRRPSGKQLGMCKVETRMQVTWRSTTSDDARWALAMNVTVGRLHG